MANPCSTKKDTFAGALIYLEATMGFEPMLRVLQTLALPLGHVAVESGAGDNIPHKKTRAGDGTRTRDLLLGKETFYQLNHARMKEINC